MSEKTIARSYRFDKKTVSRIDDIQDFLLKHDGLRLSKTGVLEYIINHYHMQLQQDDKK